MNEIVTVFILYFTSFFTLINPLGVMPVFLSMTSELSDRERKNTARKASLVSFIALIAFALSGQLLFKFFGISVNSLRVVGGILFFFAGYDMLQARLAKMKFDDAAATKKYVTDISITPLAIPMITGPGAITNAIILMEDSHSLELKIALFAAIIVVCLLTFSILWSAGRVSNFLGETGNKVLMRLMGLIVMVIAVEFFFAGLKPILQDIFNITH